jgi:hypothetical protein
MSTHQEQYDSWLRSQRLKGRDVHLEGEIRPMDVRNLGNGDPCITHNKSYCEICLTFTTFTPDGVNGDR